MTYRQTEWQKHAELDVQIGLLTEHALTKPRHASKAVALTGRYPAPKDRQVLRRNNSGLAGKPCGLRLILRTA